MTPSNLSISLGSKVDYSFADKNTFFAKGTIDYRIRSFPHLNRETGKPISHGKQGREMLGKNQSISTLNWFQTANFHLKLRISLLDLTAGFITATFCKL